MLCSADWSDNTKNTDVSSHPANISMFDFFKVMLVKLRFMSAVLIPRGNDTAAHCHSDDLHNPKPALACFILGEIIGRLRVSKASRCSKSSAASRTISACSAC